MLKRSLLALLILTAPAFARDDGQWEGSDPAIVEWYRTLMMPDAPRTSCCGEADAYWADEFEMTKEGEYIAIVTDTRDHGPLRRKPVPPGTKVVIPKHKIKFDQGNPTGHGIVFLSTTGYVYCYLPPSLS